MTPCYKLSCTGWNDRHVHFTLFDAKGANCGAIVVETNDVFRFLLSWKGDLHWNNYLAQMTTQAIGKAQKEAR